MVATASKYAKEVRIALVCYGGVSLAIYMHGVTKELHKLVRASRAFDAASDAAPTLDAITNPYGGRTDPEIDSEGAYFEVLLGMAKAGLPLSIVIDLISGTSAGGINGVCLARAIAHDRSLQAFRELWIDKGDLDVLLGGHALGTHEMREIEKLVEGLGKRLLHPTEPGAPLNGDLMSQLLYEAFNAMPPADSASPTLVPADGGLELFVTTTDMHGYDTAIPTGVGGVAHTDRSYRQVLSFGYVPGSPVDQLGDDFVAALAFAARATSSFPGAFPPVSFSSFQSALRNKYRDFVLNDAALAQRFAYGQEYNADPAHSWYIDGGVLDNGPFDLVIDAIADRPADTEVGREIVYIEPDPSPDPHSQAGPEAEPSWLGTILASRTAIPWHEPLAATLNQLRDMNATISSVSRMVDARTPDVLNLLGKASINLDVKYDDMIEQSKTVRRQAKDAAGLGYVDYGRLKAEAIASSLSAAISDELGFGSRTNRAHFVGAVLSEWVSQHKEWLSGDPDKLETALGPVDLPFRERRMRFVLQGINDLFGISGSHPAPTREDLSALKSAAWAVIENVQGMAASVISQIDVAGVFGAAQLPDAVVLGAPAKYATDCKAGIDELFTEYSASLSKKSAGSSEQLWNTFNTITAAWDPATRTKLAVRYIAFPIWDALIYPMIALTRLPQLSPIGVARFSPRDAVGLVPVDDQGNKTDRKLKGTAIAHFGGFFEKSWRENDYLWGRLDGAELICQLLGRQLSQVAVDMGPSMEQALKAILNAESGTLSSMSNQIRELLEQVDGIGAPKP